MLDSLPDELILKIFSYLDKRDLCKCSCVNRRWNILTYSDELWQDFSITDIKKPKWCASKLISIENTNYLIENRFSQSITRVDLSKMCFSFDTLDTLFQHCSNVKSLCMNFKYLQIRPNAKFQIGQCAVESWPVNKLEKLYLKNVCDMKTRRYSVTSHHQPHPPTSYDLIELEIIKLIRVLFNLNSASLRTLGLKCVDPSVISSCVGDFGQLEILLLNNINDTDSVLQELAYICKNLKCLELNKCREFQGDGLQEIIDQCDRLETLQIGKHIYPTLTELNEINWSNLKYQLKELSITTKFQPATVNERCSSAVSSCSSSSSSSTSSMSTIDLYSSTIFNYLNDESNQLEYLALADFTLRFPDERNPIDDDSNTGKNSCVRKNASPTTGESSSNLKYLFLRNIRNIKCLTDYQSHTIKSFLLTQFNLHTLDLIGLYLDSNFICSILPNLNNLKVFYFGHGKSYKKNLSTRKYLKRTDGRSKGQSNVIDWQYSALNDYKYIDIDEINYKLAQHCPGLTNLGIFYRQFELKFRKDSHVEYKNDALITLLQKCPNMKQISYLKSFKIQEENEDDFDSEDDSDDEWDADSSSGSSDPEHTVYNGRSLKRKFIQMKTKQSKKSKSYFHYIRYAIEHASDCSSHVNMKPCYGFDITPSSGHFLDFNNLDFIETSLPVIRSPLNDFHVNLLST